MLKQTTRIWSVILAVACAVLIGMAPFHSERIAAQDNGPGAAEKKEVPAAPGKAKTDIREPGGDSVPTPEKKPSVEKDTSGKKIEPAKEAGKTPAGSDLKKIESPKRESGKKKSEKKTERIKEPDKKDGASESIKKKEPKTIAPEKKRAGKKEPGKISPEKKESQKKEPQKKEPQKKEPQKKEPDKKTEPERKEPEPRVIVPREPVVMVINMGDPAGGENLADWHRRMNYRQIAYWGRTHGIRPHRDAPPVDSRAARFVSRFGSKVTVKGLDPGRRYRLWIDFVTYDIIHKHKINARLEIFASREKIGDFNFASIGRSNNPVRLDLPYHLTMRGGVELLFKEYSDQGGFWGIWDLVISDLYTLPESIDDKKTRPSGMIEGDRIVEPPPAGREKIRKGNIAPKKKSDPKKSEVPKKDAVKDKKGVPAPEPKKTPVKKPDMEKKTEPKITVDPVIPGEPRIDDVPAAPREPKTPEAPK